MMRAMKSRPATAGPDFDGANRRTMTDLRLKATDIEALTPSIKSFRLVAEDGGPLPAWEAGGMSSSPWMSRPAICVNPIPSPATRRTEAHT